MAACEICGTPFSEHPMRPCRFDLANAMPHTSNAIAVRRHRAQTMWEKGVSVAVIARILHVSQRTVGRDLLARRVQPPSRVLRGDGATVPTHRLTDLARAQRQANAVRLHHEGHSVRVIASMLAWNPATIRADLKAAGIEPVGRVITSNGRIMPARRTTPGEILARRTKAKALRGQGWTIAKIAAELGVSYMTASRDLNGMPRGVLESNPKSNPKWSTVTPSNGD